MGSDIYLRWDNQAEEEKTKQLANHYYINAGHLGYLRASLGMISETSFLRVLFSTEYWEPTQGKGLRFEFTEEKLKGLQKAGILYLISAYTGKEIECSETEKQKKTGNTIFNALKKAGIPENQIGVSRNCGFRTAIIWLESVFAFFELGLDLEKKGLNPRVAIQQ